MLCINLNTKALQLEDVLLVPGPSFNSMIVVNVLVGGTELGVLRAPMRSGLLLSFGGQFFQCLGN